MDMTLFEDMEAPALREYIPFLLWHYRVVDASWFIDISDELDPVGIDPATSCPNRSTIGARRAVPLPLETTNDIHRSMQ